MAKIFFYLGVLLAGFINISQKEQPDKEDSKSEQHLAQNDLNVIGIIKVLNSNPLRFPIP